MSPRVGVLLVLVVLLNVVMSVANYKHAEAIVTAQLQIAMEERPARARPIFSGFEKSSKTQPSSRKSDSGKAASLCRVFGPYKRAVQAAELVNRLQQAGATVVFIDSETLSGSEARKFREVLPAELSSQPGRYWVKASQTVVLQGAKPDEMRRAAVCVK